MTRGARLRERLARPGMPRFVAALVSLLLVPSLFTGLVADDYTHWLRARGQLPYGSRFDVFDFCDGSRQTTDFLKATGIVPWWGLDQIHARFLRPLTSLTHFVDYNAWPGAPWLMHAENLALSAALAAFAAILYRRLLETRWIAGLAAVLYAIDPGHAVVGWIAFRNGVFAPALGILALLAHDRWRRDGWRPGGVLGPALFAVAVAAGESAIATFAYVIAYAMALDGALSRAHKSRLLSVVPYAAVAVAWQLVYRAGGYGAVGSGIYVDPGREPLRFLREAPEHAAALLVGQLAVPPADVVLALSPSGRHVLLVAGILLFAFFCWIVAPLVARDRTARFFDLGALLAIPPICATLPSNRLLFFVSFGAIGLVAQLTGMLEAGGFASRARSAATRAFVMVWMLPHALLAPLLFVANSVAFRVAEAYVWKVSDGLPVQTELSGRTIVIVNGPELVSVVYRFLIPRDGRMEHGVRGLILSLSYGPVHVTRTGPQTLTVRADDDLTAVPLASLFRADSYPMRQGEVFHPGAAVIHVDAVATNGHPSAATFELEAPLEDPRFFWVAWDKGRFVAFTPPPVGSSAVLGN